MYAYAFLIVDKSNALDVLKIYKTEVEHQLEKSLRTVRSYCDGEYYGRYDNRNQLMGDFVDFLQDCGIVAQYTRPNTPSRTL